MSKKALGKGLDVFLPDDYGLIKNERLVEVDIDQLYPNPDQPRLKFDQESLEELAASIRETGLIQPLVAVPEEQGYRIIVGERRWRAAQLIGLKKVPVLIRRLPRDKQIEISLVENLQRENLNPIEVARVYQRMAEEFGLTHEEIAVRVGKDRTSVTNHLRLLELPADIQELLAAGKLSMGHGRALAALEDPQWQRALAEKIVAKGLSVREAEKLVQRFNKKAKSPRKKSLNLELMAMEEELMKSMGTKVQIEGDLKKGVIKIHYYSPEDLYRVYSRIKGER